MNAYAESRILLRYAIRDGRPVHVRDFEYLRGRDGGREDIYCPECDGRVTVRLSPEHKKRDHFAHLPDSACLLRNGGESATHQNSKFYLAEQLRKFRRATLIIKCAACKNDYSYVTIPEYNEVRTEMKLGQRRPDISCLDSGEAVGAAEIAHTNAVSFQRRVDLDSYGIEWFEIPALNVHPKNFRFVHAASVLSVDAAGAGILYPAPPKYCDVCQRAMDNQNPSQSVSINCDDPEVRRLLGYARREGVSLRGDEYGPRLSPRLSSGLYVAVSNYRKDSFLRGKKGALNVSED